MKTTTKGALAAGSAAVLLMGGAGSLAFWTTNTDVAGGTIASGSLKISTATCPAAWKYQTGAAKAGQDVVLFVPGDKITKSCTFVLTATGDNLAATMSAPTELAYSATPSAPSLQLPNTATYKIGGTSARTLTNGGTVTSADNGATVTATFDVDDPVRQQRVDHAQGQRQRHPGHHRDPQHDQRRADAGQPEPLIDR